MKYIPQLDISDCGAACIAMIASNFGRHLNIAKIREAAGTDIIGTNIQGLITAGKNYGLKGRGVKGDASVLNHNIPVPFIAHVRLGDNNIGVREHFVVVKKITSRFIYYWDPDPLSRKNKVSKEEFIKIWSNCAIFFEPEDSFNNVLEEKETNLLLKFLPVFAPHKKVLFYALLSSILLLAFGLASSFYYKYIFDEVIYSKAGASLAMLTIAILVVTVVQSIVGAIRNVLLAHFSYKTDLQLNFSYLSHILKLPLSFFESRKNGEILSRLGDLDKIRDTLSSAVLSGVMDVLMLLVSAPVLWGISSKLFTISFVTGIFASLLS